MMKNRMIMAWALAAAAALAACSEDPGEPGVPAETGKVDVYFGASTSSTRASITIGGDRFATEWTDGDSLALYTLSPANAKALTCFRYDAATRRYGGSLDAGTGVWHYAAFFPYDISNGKDFTLAKLPFENGRVQTGNAYNSRYDLMAADGFTTTAAEPGKLDDGSDMHLTMHRLTSILEFAFTTSEYASETVRAVSIEADRNIAADYVQFKYNTGNAFDAAAAQATLASSRPQPLINMVYASGSEPTVADSRAYFNVLPDTYAGLTVTVWGTQHKASLAFPPSGAFEVGTLYHKDVALTGWTECAPPSLAWTSNPDFSAQEITEAMDVKIAIEADHGIKELKVDVTSTVLNSMGITSLNLAHPTDLEMSLRAITGLPDGPMVLGQHRVMMDISNLVPLIKALEEGAGQAQVTEHTFTVNLTDNAGNTLSKPILFRYVPATAILYNGDADLWKGTASLSVRVATVPTDLKARVRVKGESAWNDATLTKENEGSYTAKIAPTWSSASNAAGIQTWQIAAGTGIRAAATYEYQLVADDTVKYSGEFIAPAGDVIPNGTMDHWTTYTVPGGTLLQGPVPYPNETVGDVFWSSGNNKMTATLCTEGTSETGYNGTAYAQLHGTSTLSIFAAGNLFTGNFEGASGYKTYGMAKFGVAYAYKARPRALKVHYLATITPMTNIGSGDPNKDSFVVNTTPDPARIFVAIVDWTSPQVVTSGVGITASGVWDPTKQTAADNGAILGYGSLMIDQSTTGWVTAELPIYYYDKEATPTDGNLTLAISAAADAYGDYLTGSKNNYLLVEDFEWVY